ncbi:MAG: pyridoxamine 5'-phosphate oxidase [Candidatus Dormibacteraeota bacterium]|nr:pyridoxamine 5'-phosphate oxidase [Candidatus Dormibacteraeota bacterium]
MATPPIDTDRPLSAEDLGPDPIAAFAVWFDLAGRAGEPQPNAMALATVRDREPQVRMVLLHRADERGFTFFTNYASRKGEELAANPRAALVIHWPLLHRQVRAAGAVIRTSREESVAYWLGRPWGSRIASTASRQSSVIESREDLEERVRELERRYPEPSQPDDVTPPLPDFWGGYRLVPDWIEFWQGRRNRLHDRIVFLREGEGWRTQRLDP